MMFRKGFILLLLATGALSVYSQSADSVHIIHPLEIRQVQINDPFWSPRLQTWRTKTVYDVFDKLEGRYTPDRKAIIEEKAQTGSTRNAFRNFDLVAQGKKDIGAHDGPPWYDGLVYETIRGAADLLAAYPDARLEAKIDGYIDRIAAAQAANPNGYLNTYTTLTRSNQPWGTNGGNEVWQHDLYNAGMLTEAGIHYYQATGKTKLLQVAVKMANYITQQMGPAPKQNIIPGHGGPEEAFIKLYRLFKNEPSLKNKLAVPVDENSYYKMAAFWIEDRGHYANADGSWSRPNTGAYNQDQSSVFDQQTIEGHAVRATLLATGVAAAALENRSPVYISTANNYWNNMAGKRMFITGGEGAIAQDEKFGADYYLPESAYLETCAAIGSAFFSERMNELQANGRYMDVFERVLYNNVLSGISMDGTHYSYENPLTAADHPRWSWHECPCCPPMFLKMAGVLPRCIYAQSNDSVFVNLFIGSTAHLQLGNAKVALQQTTQYPWKGASRITVAAASAAPFTINVRIPGWAQGQENPFGLYHAAGTAAVSLKVNNEAVAVQPVNGYVSLKRVWKKGDVITLQLPMQPRLVYPNSRVKTIAGKAAIAAGPLVYAFEGNDNPGLDSYTLVTGSKLEAAFKPGLLNGINVITGKVTVAGKSPQTATAIPFYAIGNRGRYPYRVWLPVQP